MLVWYVLLPAATDGTYVSRDSEADIAIALVLGAGMLTWFDLFDWVGFDVRW